jgi:hypothetical protein
MFHTPFALSDFETETAFVNLIDTDVYRNVFNPSVQICDGITYIAFRAFSLIGENKFHAYLLKYDSSNKTKQVSDISDHCTVYGIDVCADPKLVLLDNDIWLTFNTGYSISDNSIYLLSVMGEMGKPYRCELPQRNRIEKNWAFFKENNSLQAIYSLKPFKKIFLSRIDEASSTYHFEFTGNSLPAKSTNINLSIGTQLICDNHFFYLVAHEKIRIAGKRIYLGRFVRINEDKTGIEIHPARVIHSYKSLLGAKKKHNSNLLSCTYFSGLFIRGNDFVVSYGINDVDFSIKKIDRSIIWS